MDNNQHANTKKLWHDTKQVSRKLDLLLAKLERQGERLKKMEDQQIIVRRKPNPSI